MGTTFSGQKKSLTICPDMKKPNKFLDKRDKIKDIVFDFSIFDQEKRIEYLGKILNLLLVKNNEINHLSTLILRVSPSGNAF
ncbi:MAG: hypothetical protein V2B13_17120 [Pseudomonadota bacterium]